MRKSIEIIAVGASAGGVKALKSLFSGLSADLNIPIVVIQHLPSDSNVDPALVFGLSSDIKVVEAIDKMKIESDRIYFAPPSYHLLVENDKSFSLTQDDLVNFSRPSIDVFFESMAAVYKEKCCGIILTGANSDGSLGLKTVKNNAGVVVIQEPKFAEIPFMPQSSLDAVEADFVGNIEQIANFINQLKRGKLI